MKEFKGTPGPWSIGYYGDGDGIFIAGTYGGPDPTYICSVRPDLRSSQSESNVHLISAAPDLLEALQAMLRKAYKQNWNDQYPDEISKAQGAISKALGEE